MSKQAAKLTAIHAPKIYAEYGPGSGRPNAVREILTGLTLGIAAGLSWKVAKHPILVLKNLSDLSLERKEENQKVLRRLGQDLRARRRRSLRCWRMLHVTAFKI